MYNAYQIPYSAIHISNFLRSIRLFDFKWLLHQLEQHKTKNKSKLYFWPVNKESKIYRKPFTNAIHGCGIVMIEIIFSQNQTK